MRKDTLIEILTLSVNAPSGHNAQPWKFIAHDSMVQLLNLPEKDEVLFNYDLRGSIIAHGALIENITIVASNFGYSIEIDLFPNSDDGDLVAELKFSENNSHKYGADLFSSIENRATNRRPYNSTPLSKPHLGAISSFVDSENNSEVSTILLEDRKLIELASLYFSTGDKILFQNESVHKSLFTNVSWTLEEEEKKREGLFVKTKELPFLAEFMFKHVLSKWSLVSKLQKFGLSENSRKIREALYKKSALMAIFFAPDASRASLIETGRRMQRLWLKVTELNIQAQPLSVGLLYLGQLVKESPSTDKLTHEEKTEIIASYEGIIEEFSDDKNKVPLFSFRFGYAEPPTARSLKKKPSIIF